MDKNAEVNSKSRFDFTKYGKVVSFLALEIIAFISFSLGNSYIFYSIIGIALFVLLLLVTFGQIKKEGYPTFAFFLIPLLSFGLFSIISHFTKDTNFAMPSGGLFLIPFGLVVFPSCGYLLAHEKTFSISKALLVIYSAIGAYVFINFIGTMIQFAPFHTLRYADKYLFYNGEITSVPVGKMAYALIGFKFAEVSLEYYLMYPLILLTSSIFLFFIKPKENKKLFITYACLSGLGLVAFLFSISKLAAIVLLVMAYLGFLIVATGKKKLDVKFISIVSIIMASVLIIVLILFVLNAQAIAGKPLTGIQSFISGNSYLNSVFNTNKYAKLFNIAADGIFSKYKINGIMTGSVDGYTNTYDFFEHFGLKAIYPTNSVFFDTIITSGTIGLLFFIMTIGAITYTLYKYCKNSSDSVENKAVITAFITIFMVYSLGGFDMSPMVFKSDLYPFYMNNLFLICLILIGYAFYSSTLKVSKPVKEVPEVESVTLSGGEEDEVSF